MTSIRTPVRLQIAATLQIQVRHLILDKVYSHLPPVLRVHNAVFHGIKDAWADKTDET